MIEILEFVFAGFWRWLGFAILLAIVTQGLWQFGAAVINAIKREWER